MPGRFDTGFIDRHLADLTHLDPKAEAAVVGAAVEALLAPQASEPAETAMARSLDRHRWLCTRAAAAARA